MKRLLLSLLAFVLMTPALAQSDISSLLDGKLAPNSFKLKQLDASWKRISVHEAGSFMDAMAPMMEMLAPLMMSGMGGLGGMAGAGGAGAGGGGMEGMMGMAALSALFGGGGEAPGTSYYTKGLTTKIGDETFLVVYTVQRPKMDFAKMAAEDGKNASPEKMMESLKITADTNVQMSLLNVKSISSMGGIRAFDLAKELEDLNKSSALMNMMNQATLKPVPNAPDVTAKDTPEPKVQVAPAMTANDAQLLAQAILKDDAQLRKANLKASLSNGVIVLSGTVKSAALKAKAETAIKNALANFDKNLKVKVVNRITVK